MSPKSRACIGVTSGEKVTRIARKRNIWDDWGYCSAGDRLHWMIRTHTFRLTGVRPSKRARLDALLTHLTGLRRMAVDFARERYKAGGKHPSAVDMNKALTKVRRSDECVGQWPVHVQQQLLRRVDHSYRRFFADRKKGIRGGSPPEAQAGADRVVGRLHDQAVEDGAVLECADQGGRPYPLAGSQGQAGGCAGVPAVPLVLVGIAP